MMLTGAGGPTLELATYLYEPHPRLEYFLSRIEEFALGRISLSNDAAGKLLEQVAAVCFSGLEGSPTISVRTADAQFDVLQLASTDMRWLATAWALGFKPGQRGILVECKCYGPETASLRAGKPSGERVAQREFARLGGLMLASLHDAIGLGVMLSLWGGTDGGYTVALADSKLFRMKFLARFGTPIIDLTIRDIRRHCLESGGLVRLLHEKVQELETLAAMPALTGPGETAPIPDYLLEALRRDG